MIPKYQRILFWSLNGAILLMALVLLRGCEQARERLTRPRNETPLAAPIGTPNETVHFALANDATGTIALADREIALPTETSARARVMLGRLIAEYSYKGSMHPLESGPAVDDVFLLDLPLRPAIAAGSKNTAAVAPTDTLLDSYSLPTAPGGQLAVVNLHGSFADGHPAGIEPEKLTIDSILGTLFANFPRIVQVRFLVDGQPRETLNGHVDLMRTYLVLDTTSRTGQDPAELR